MKPCIDLIWILLICTAVGCKMPSAAESNESNEVEADSGDIRGLLSSEDSIGAPDSTNIEAVQKNDTLVLSSSDFKIAECRKCNVQLLLSLESRIEQLNAQDVYDLLCTMDGACKDNVEFIEIGNNVLYKVISNYPGPVIRTLSSQQSFDAEFIYEQLEAPILDYQFDRIIYFINKIKGNAIAKQRISAAVTKAKEGL